MEPVIEVTVPFAANIFRPTRKLLSVAFTIGVQHTAARGVPKVLQVGLSDKMILRHMPASYAGETGFGTEHILLRLRAVFILESKVRFITRAENCETDGDALYVPRQGNLELITIFQYSYA